VWCCFRIDSKSLIWEEMSMSVLIRGMEMRDPETGRFLNGHNRYEQLKTVDGAEWKPLLPIANDEIWKDIGGFEGRYRISNYGRVRNREGLVKSQRKRNGYYSVGLRDGKGRKHFSLHRLVADAFVKNKNPEAFKQINHRDENKENNRADNLEWCDGMYNTHYGTAIERMRERRWGRAPTIIPAEEGE
jgi:hypothetical protein